MSQPCSLKNKPISKGNQVWKRVSKVTNRLSAKGVPAPILHRLQDIHVLTPTIITDLRFQEGVSLRQMCYLAKMQSVEVLQLSLRRSEEAKHMNLQRKDTQMTSLRSSSSMKENLGEIETNNSARPQEAEAVFS